MRTLPRPGEACSHCGYYHFKLGGHLKWYVGAMVCPIYVSLLLEDAESWGLRLRRAPAHGREKSLKKCGAPSDFVCFHKGTMEDRGIRRCYSPDGFTTEIPDSQKVVLLVEGTEIVGAERNEKLECPHIGVYRRPSVAKSGQRARRRGGKNGSSKPVTFNEMPLATDPRKQAVYTELWGRIGYLKDHKLPITADTVAALSGHAAWKNRDVHVA